MLIRPSVGPDQPHEHPQRRRLAGAVGARAGRAPGRGAPRRRGRGRPRTRPCRPWSRPRSAAARPRRRAPRPTPAGGGAGPSSTATAHAEQAEGDEHAEQHPPAGRRPRRPASGRVDLAAPPARPSPASADRVDGRLRPAARTPGRWRRRRAAWCGRPRSGARSPGRVTCTARRLRRVRGEPGQRQRRDQAGGQRRAAAGGDVVELGEQGRRAARPRRRRAAPSARRRRRRRRSAPRCRTPANWPGISSVVPPERRGQRPQSGHAWSARAGVPPAGVTIGCAGPLTATTVRRAPGRAVQTRVGARPRRSGVPPCDRARHRCC